MAALDEEDIGRLLGKGSESLTVSGPYGSIGVPSSGWLGQLPEIYQAGKARRTREATLAELGPEADLTNANEAAALATKLFKKGLWAEGNRILTAAQKSIADTALLEYMKKLPGNKDPLGVGGGQPAAPGTPAPYVPTPLPDVEPGAAAPAAPPAYPWSTVPIPGAKPQSALPQQPVAAGPMSPSDEIIARAQGAGPPTPPGPQLAQAGGGLPPGALPPVSGMPANPPPWLREAVEPGVTPGGLPQGGPQPAAQAESYQQYLSTPRRPIPPNFPLSVPPTVNPEIRARLENQYREAVGLGRGGPLTATARAEQQAAFNETLKHIYPDKENQQYVTDMMQRVYVGEPIIPQENWRTLKVTAPKTVEAAIERSKTLQEGMTKSQSLVNSMEIAKAIVENPKFSSGGLSSETIQSMASSLIGLKDFLVSQGADPDSLPSLHGLSTTVALQEALKGLMNSSVFKQVGSLGNGFSNPDREFMTAIFPSLRGTTEGNKLLIELTLHSAKSDVRLGNILSDYMIAKSKTGTASPDEINKIVSGFNARNTPTELMNRVRAFGSKPPPPNTFERRIDTFNEGLRTLGKDLGFPQIGGREPLPPEWGGARGPYKPGDTGSTPDGRRWIIGPDGFPKPAPGGQ